MGDKQILIKNNIYILYMAVKYIKRSKSKKRFSCRNTCRKAYQKRNRTRRNKYRKSMRGG